MMLDFVSAHCLVGLLWTVSIWLHGYEHFLGQIVTVLPQSYYMCGKW